MPLLLSLALLGMLFLNAFLGHLLALVTLTILLIMEVKSPLARLLWLIVLPLVSIAYVFSMTTHGYGEPVMAIWLTAAGLRVVAAR